MSIVGSYFSSYFNYIYGGFVKMSNSTDDGKKGNNENTDDTKKGNNTKKIIRYYHDCSYIFDLQGLINLLHYQLFRHG